jgi:uncharacterized Fe-S radical SAM superfamily protein PflX
MKSKKDLITRAGNTLYEICPRGCGVNRLEDQERFCRTGSQPKVSGYVPHFGEEACLVGCLEQGCLMPKSVGII